ncbi:helix-turn-helix transcriptional regulator [Rhodococcus sp. BE178]|uniref:helix-turn-helix transcriptional regulator n=1 Tax=Rhodococcus sp. BE178 TaxID=2817737 RepID=UPI003D19EE39
MDTTVDRLGAALCLRAAVTSGSLDAGSPGISTGRVLFELAAAVPYRHAVLSWWDPVAGAHVTSASLGYHADSVDVVNHCMPRHPLFRQLRDTRLPMRLFDVPEAMRSGPVFDRVIRSHNYSDGLSQCLHTRDGRYIGMLNMSTTDGQRFDQQSVVTVTLLSDVLAEALDPLAQPGPSPRVGPGDAALVVDADGSARALTGDAPVVLFGPGTTGGRLAGAVAASGRAADFVFVGAGSVLCVRMEPVRRGGTLVACRPGNPPMELTGREAEVLALLPTGASNGAIAARLRIGPATVATHLERILRKIAAPNRTAAAATAARWGLTPI